MLKKILIGLAAVLAVFAVIVALQPSEFKVTQTANISASPSVVFAQVNDFHHWAAWSPWERLDPQMQRSYEGAPAGTGAVYGWVGNKDVGEGRMTIIDSRPSELIKINLEFIKPFAATSLTEFAFLPVNDQTQVTWTMTGKNNFIAKAMCMFMDMDEMVGKDFEKGLAQLKAVSEAAK